MSTRVRHLPKGVVGVISPWNYPLVLSTSDAIAALVAGNGIVIKPDSQTPFTAIRAFELLEEAGLPEGLVQIVTGAGRTVGTAIIEAADYMMFTGSTATGRSVARQAGEQLIGVSAELGGKNAMIITGDVTQIDLPRSKSSGLLQAPKILKNIPGIEIHRFTASDVVRHPLVQRIIDAYEQAKTEDGSK